MSTYSTDFFSEKIIHCDDIDELKKKLIPQLRDQRSIWAEKIEQIISDKGYSCKKLAQLCKVSEPAVRKWRKGSLPQNRDMFIRIGFAAGYDLDEMNTFLKRYGKCPQLYVKSLEDSVCIFVLRSKHLEHTYETYLRTLDMIKHEFQEQCEFPNEVYSTVQFSEELAYVKNLDEMAEFVKNNVQSYKHAYMKLYSYIIAFLHVNLMSDGDGGKASFHAMASESQWSSSLRHCISEIRNKRWFPLRHKIISLGLHLNMDTDAINQMLQYAQMEPLYAKNPIEASIMWAIEEAKLCSDDGAIIPDGSSDLCNFVKDVLIQLDLAEEGNYLIDDL